MKEFKAAIGTDEITDKKVRLLRACIAEFMGIMFLNFVGCGSVFKSNVVAVSLAFGTIAAGTIQTIGHVSGGHINPAVTVGMLVLGKISIIRAILYILVQCAGAIAGTTLIRVFSSEISDAKFGVVSLASGMNVFQGLGIEFSLGFMLVTVVCGACDTAKLESKGLSPIFIGMAISAGHFVGIPRTGGAMNPARALGSAVAMGEYSDHWVYWAGPILGGIAAALIYTYVIGSAETLGPKVYSSVSPDEQEVYHTTNI
ncbi:hypothetical protein PV327_005253 [Microctonus hyperodae]|uniref:Aquaporin AQPAn.G n=1 Tax=Microctonus hyperodae TaxID=165561 RepID=A0AA39G195_MICHY|nr:hypothetical protein PV327_005253 [Microctonus hyperodae]